MNEPYQPTQQDIKEVKGEALACLIRVLEIAELLDNSDKEFDYILISNAIRVVSMLFERDFFGKK